MCEEERITESALVNGGHYYCTHDAKEGSSQTFRVTEPNLTQEDLGDISYMSLESSLN